MAHIKLPGLIDPHVHLRTPGQSHKEDFYTGTAAALAGGFTTILDMPNNTYPITTQQALEEKITLAKDAIVCNLGFYFGSLGDNTAEFGKVKNTVCGLKLYLNETTGNFVLNPDLLHSIFVAWSGVTLKPILVHAEGDMVQQVLDTVKQTNHPTHFCHVASKEDLIHILAAKEENLPVTCGVTPHHLFLTNDDEKLLGPLGKMKPTLKSKEDVQFLWQNLAYIDVIESDHAPHTLEEKQQTNPAFGVPGLETTLPLLLTAVHEGKLQIQDIIRLCHDNPARIFGIKPRINTYVEIDTEIKYTITKDKLHTKCGWSPFINKSVVGKVLSVTLDSERVFDGEKIIARPGSGSIIHP